MSAPVDPDLRRAGLCAGCRFGEILRSKRSAFLRCARADSDANFPRYPGLPVVSCRGFEAGPVAYSESSGRSTIR